ncbi:hypothetical protein E2562_019291 [Oryza meyeriana var. granulata]|uniref:Uncharacterized protein n=1 Tax=Oryza meyeriana var. granulata TaxID=110450 RepID=A0A6G1FA87_9ORYZ|nr:hypothetical protein E2562_019291 [Oryza meyeriana var. granulata]
MGAAITVSDHLTAERRRVSLEPAPPPGFNGKQCWGLHTNIVVKILPSHSPWPILRRQIAVVFAASSPSSQSSAPTPALPIPCLQNATSS